MPEKKTVKAKKENKATKAAEIVAEPEQAKPKEDEVDVEDFVISEKDLKSDRYYEAVGRRKTAVARVRFYTRGDKQFLINNKPYQEYFSQPEFQEIAVSSLKKMNCLDKFRVLVRVTGGGVRAQAEAIRHGAARVLIGFNPNFRKRLRKAGYLTRDPRMRERKKFGLKRARRAPQWSKR
ncbi:30S ribosomal protein S9 [Patescibacteria group bacterium]|nr:30S ribosomal protein S9 [Patescibacteria group bacterium]